MNMHASNLDIEKFRKIHAHVVRGASHGERENARRMAEAMAAKAGMTYQAAVSSLDAKPAAKPASFFDGFEDWMEEKEPGYKAKRAQENAERQDRYAARRAELLKQFGTIKAIFDPTDRERLLLQAGKQFVTKRRSYVDVCGTRRYFSDEFAGVHGTYFRLGDVDPAAIAAIKAAFPFPQTVAEAFEELRSWDKLEKDRAQFYDHHEFYFDLPIELRVELLRDVMRNQPVTSWEDLDARFHYKSYSWQQQWIDEREFEDAEWSRLFADVQILRARSATTPTKSGQSDTPAHCGPGHDNPGAQSGHRTTSQKRADVLSMLDAHPDLSSREIARRVGVSPQTVSNWRQRKAK